MIRALLAVTVAILVVACRGGAPTSPPTGSPRASLTPSSVPKVLASAGPKSTVTASPQVVLPKGAPSTPAAPTPTPTPLARTRPPTGSGLADAAIVALDARNIDALLALVTYAPRPCTDGPEADSLPPLCPPSVPTGTVLDTITVTHCGGGSLLPAAVRAELEAWLERVEYVYGAYRVTADREWFWGRQGIFIVTSLQRPNGTSGGGHLLVTDDPETGTWIAWGCARTPAEESGWITRYGTLEPLGTVLP